MDRLTTLEQELASLRAELRGRKLRSVWLVLGLALAFVAGTYWPHTASDLIAQPKDKAAPKSIDVERISIRGSDGDVLWQLSAKTRKRGARNETVLLFQDKEGVEMAALSRAELFGEGNAQFPLFRVGNDQAFATMGMDTQGRGTRVPFLTLARTTREKDHEGEGIDLRVWMTNGPTLKIHGDGSDGKETFTAGQRTLQLTDREGKVIFSQPPR